MMEDRAVTDLDVIWALDRQTESDLPGLDTILGKYAGPAEWAASRPSAERRKHFLAKATAVGLIGVAAKPLTLREFIGAPLLLPVYIAAAVSAIGTAVGQLATVARRGLAALVPGPAFQRVQARLLMAPAGGFAQAAALRGSSVTPTLAYQAGSFTIFLSTSRQVKQSHMAISLEALVAPATAEPSVLAGSRVQLVEAGGRARTAHLDRLGTFSFEGIASGTHRLEMQLTDIVVVIEDLQLGA
jgi:hypothetical protein